jgi:hypothetical protein
MKEKKRKNGFKIILCMIVFLVFGSIVCFAQSLGDVNSSGSIDIVDALLIAQYYVGLNPSGFAASVADANCDGSITIVDALRVAQYYVGLLASLSCGTAGPSGTPTVTAAPTPTPQGTAGPTSPPGTTYTGNATWFDSMGTPYGGCGIGQPYLDTQNFLALNVQNSPGDYTSFYSRPLSSDHASVIGMFNNGHNCGRWVHVTIGDYCNGVNDGQQNLPFCRGGSGWVSDAYNGAENDFIVADSCYDSNAWCRDDPYHVDLAHAALNQFVLNGKAVGDMDPNHWNNRQVHWYFEEAPNYTGDIRIGFIQDSKPTWTPIAITHLQNGIHGLDYYDGSSWIKATMDADMGQDFMIGPTSSGGTSYRIRVYDVNDQLINNGRIYKFSYPSSCGSACTGPFTEVSYTTE